MHTSYADSTLPEGLQRLHGASSGRVSEAKKDEPITTAKSPDEAFYTSADKIVLKELFRDINKHKGIETHDAITDKTEESLDLLSGLNDPGSGEFQPDVLSSWDFNLKGKSGGIQDTALRLYVNWARTVVRHETDVVFVSHIIIYLTTTLPSAIYLYYNFHYLHGVLHTMLIVWFAGSFTLLMHNHIHNRGVLSKRYAIFDFLFPYILEPLMGHTWDSYFYHHVKHHHVEGNGPDDLSSTIRYQRDSPIDFLRYEARYLFLLWYELPLYFARKGKYSLAIRSFVSEIISLTFMCLMASWKFRPTMFALILPFCILRPGLMIGNWGQHALVDEVDPVSDFRSSITLIDVPSNRFCFNDGYHTSHHLNPRRHWRAHPQAFLQAKEKYAKEGALVFHNVDYLAITFCLLTKRYKYLAKQLVPMGDQVGMTVDEIAAMLERKTRKFSEEEVAAKFKK